jgi:general secretion pathway protein E
VVTDPQRGRIGRAARFGEIRLALQGRPIDFRVSVMPSVYGEDAVLRILDKKALTDEQACCPA